MNLESIYKDGDRLPEKYANIGVKSGLGQNISPLFKWDEPPVGVKSFALIMVDYEAVSGHFIHWLVIDIPADVDEMPEGASLTVGMPDGSRELNTDYRRPGYGGGRPPVGTGDHGYKTTVYALNVERLDIQPDIGLAEFEAELAGKVLAAADLTAIYSQD